MRGVGSADRGGERKDRNASDVFETEVFRTPVAFVAAAAVAESIADVQAWERLDNTIMARSSDVVRRPRWPQKKRRTMIEAHPIFRGSSLEELNISPEN